MSLVSGTEHHGGICMLVKKQRTFSLQGYLDVPRQEDCLVVLDQVNNAQNLGGVVRTCAFYGIKNVVTNQVEQLYAPAAMRVAEGGMEHIRILETESTEIALEAFNVKRAIRLFMYQPINKAWHWNNSNSRRKSRWY